MKRETHLSEPGQVCDGLGFLSLKRRDCAEVIEQRRVIGNERESLVEILGGERVVLCLVSQCRLLAIVPRRLRLIDSGVHDYRKRYCHGYQHSYAPTSSLHALYP